MNTGDTSFVLISTALVFLMTPGLALFYGGMVRKKNVLSTLMHSWIVIG
ncbi:MAG TPA: ammonia channel protein, partial [Desulfosporosinus sp.]